MPTEQRRGRHRGRLASAILISALAAAGCGGSTAKGPDGADPCDPPQLDDDPLFDPVATCRQVIQLADTQLGLVHAPVSRVHVRFEMCPQGARCLARVPTGERWVIYQFWSGPPRMVYVGPPDPVDDQSQRFVARPLEPVPDWLLEELGLEGG